MRAVRLLAILGEGRPGDGLSLTELSDAAGLHKTTALRLLYDLEGAHLVERAADGRYRLGPRLVELASGYLDDLDLVRQGHPLLEQLTAATHETAHLAVLSGTDVVYVDKVESQESLRMVSRVGARNPAYCTSLGRAILAFADEPLLAEVVAAGMPARTSNTITSEAGLREELARVRSDGFAIDREENRIGICCAGAPVRDRRGRVVGAISISGPSIRIKDETVPALGAEVRGAAAGLSRRLGYAPIEPAQPLATAGR